MIEELIVWFVRGADPDATVPILFTTKIAAEAYARHVFPDETPDQRYARIFCRPVYANMF